MTATMPPPAMTGEGPERFADAADQYATDGPVDRATEERIVKDAEEIADLFFAQLAPIWERAVRHWGLYLGDKADPRTDEEKDWRANIHVPLPFRNTEAKVAVLNDIMLSGPAIIQAEGVGEEDTGGRNIERLLDYVLRKNRIRKQNPMMLRAIGVQGGEFLELYWTEQAHPFMYVPSQGDIDEFRTACMTATSKGAPQPMPSPATEEQAFAVWREYVNRSGIATIPEPPFAGMKAIRTYRGPKFGRRSMFDVWLDPAVDEIAEQQAMILRGVKSERWVKAYAGDEPWQIFDSMAVERALDKTSTLGQRGQQRFSTHRNAINEILGISETKQRDPLWENACELMTHYFAGEPLGEYPYVVTLNGVIINKNPRQMPFMHGQVNVFNVRNLAIPGLAHGLSDYLQLESIFHEVDNFRNLRADASKLAGLPIVAKLASIAMPEMMRRLVPGMIVPVQRMDAIQQLFKIQVPEALYREPPEMVRDTEDAMATGPNVQGQTASVGRIPATTEQSRFTQAVSRLKLSASQIEEDLADFPFQIIALLYEKGDAEIRAKVGGKGDPYITVSKREMLEALDQDYRFMASTNAINKDILAKNLVDFGKAYGANLTPVELRQIMADVLETMGTRNAAKIVSEEGTRDAKTAYEMKKQMAIAQAQAQQQQAQMGAMQTPNDVGPGEMAAMEQAGGGVEVPPSGAQGADGGGPTE